MQVFANQTRLQWVNHTDADAELILSNQQNNK